MADATSEPLKFAADRMLGRLARWLRVIGQDVIYGRHLSGYGLIHAARAEDRLVLTRDRGLKHKQPPKFIFIDSNDYREQLRQVIRECGLRAGEALFTRCLECNAVLQTKTKDSVEHWSHPCFSTQESFSVPAVPASTGPPRTTKNVEELDISVLHVIWLFVC
jgi:uncharacterized protein with PIN domain